MRNAVINTALGKAPDEAERDMFIDYIDRFTVWHFRVLNAVKEPPAWADKYNVRYRPALASSLSDFLVAAFPALDGPIPGVRSDFLPRIWKGLHDAGFVNTDTTGGMMSENGWRAQRTTEAGVRFLEFIEE